MLIDLAIGNKTITYGRLNTSSDSGYDFQDPEERAIFTEDIADISLSEVQNGRPPLGAVVVYKSGSVGKDILENLYEICTELYKLSPETTKPNAKFLKEPNAMSFGRIEKINKSLERKEDRYLNLSPTLSSQIKSLRFVNFSVICILIAVAMLKQLY